MTFTTGRGTGRVGHPPTTKRSAWPLGRGTARVDLLLEPMVQKTDTSFVFKVQSSSRPNVMHAVTISPEALAPKSNGKITHRLYDRYWRYDCTCEQGMKHIRCKHVMECLERIGIIDLVATVRAACLDRDGDVDKNRTWLKDQAGIAYRDERECIRTMLRKKSAVQKPRPAPKAEEDVDAKSAHGILASLTPKQVRDLPRDAMMALLSAMGRDVAPTAPEPPAVPEGPPIPEAPPIPEYVQDLYDVL